MRAFTLVLRLLGYAFGLALLAYFVVREIDDRWLTNKILPSEQSQEWSAPVAAVDEPMPEEAPESDEPAELVVFEFDAVATQASLESELQRTQSALARALEAKLLRNLDNVRGAYQERGEVMTEVRDTVSGIVAEIEREGAEATTETARAIGGIETSLAALSRSNQELDRSLEIWAEAYHSLTEVEKISAKVLDERNYNFISYEVGTAETLPEISRKLALEHGVENADLGTLIPMFNDIDLVTRQFGTRRTATRTVANETLRIPLPKTSGELLGDQQLGTRLLSQRAMIAGAKDQQAGVQAELSTQVALLRKTVQRVEGLRALTGLMNASLESLDGTDSLEMIGDEATAEQRAAWDYFNEAFRQYRLTPDRELQRLAKADLESATRALLDAYITAEPSNSALALSNGPDSAESTDLDWLESFIERYEPAPAVAGGTDQ